MALSISRSLVVLGVLAAGVSLFAVGCSVANTSSTSSTMPAATARAPVAKGGAELWADTCGHCHNLRSPTSYSDAQWEIAVHDMRVRANLTGEEQRKITEFLKSAN
jgi:cytochrome c5